MAVLTLEKSRFRSVQLDITDVIVKKKKKNLYIYIHTHVYNRKTKGAISQEAAMYTFDCRKSREVCEPSLRLQRCVLM